MIAMFGSKCAHEIILLFTAICHYAYPKKTSLVARVFGATLMDGNSVFLNGMLQRSRSMESRVAFEGKPSWTPQTNQWGHTNTQ